MNREAIKGALSAFKLYRMYPYPANYKHLLEAADNALARIPGVQLTATVRCNTTEAVNVDTVAVSTT